MRLFAVAAAVIGALALQACESFPLLSASSRPDPFLWLEQIDSPRALEWVEAQNARSLGQLEHDPRFGPLQRDAVRIAESRDRLPVGAVRDGYYYNFWQ